jgi:hypothetical protein
MDLWYGHAGITVVLLTKLPEGSDKARSYESRGWTTFERCSAELGKSFNLKVAKWKLVIDAGSEDGDVQRRLPTAPTRMEELLNADKGGGCSSCTRRRCRRCLERSRSSSSPACPS